MSENTTEYGDEAEVIHDEQVFVEEVYAPTLADYWGPVLPVLQASRDSGDEKRAELTITTIDRNETRGRVDQIEADWVSLVHDAGLASPEMVYWIARAHITRVVARTGS